MIAIAIGSPLVSFTRRGKTLSLVSSSWVIDWPRITSTLSEVQKPNRFAGAVVSSVSTTSGHLSLDTLASSLHSQHRPHRDPAPSPTSTGRIPEMELLGTLRLLGTPTSIAVSCTLFATTFLFYRWLLPKPIPGIPYSKPRLLFAGTVLTGLFYIRC
jgi:hypothetical protein